MSPSPRTTCGWPRPGSGDIIGATFYLPKGVEAGRARVLVSREARQLRRRQRHHHGDVDGHQPRAGPQVPRLVPEPRARHPTISRTGTATSRPSARSTQTRSSRTRSCRRRSLMPSCVPATSRRANSSTCCRPRSTNAGRTPGRRSPPLDSGIGLGARRRRTPGSASDASARAKGPAEAVGTRAGSGIHDGIGPRSPLPRTSGCSCCSWCRSTWCSRWRSEPRTRSSAIRSRSTSRGTGACPRSKWHWAACSASITRAPSGSRSSIRTFLYVGVASLICVVLGYAVAYYMARYGGKRKILFLVLLVSPFWISYLMRIFAWQSLLQLDGYVNRILEWLHIISVPVDWLGGKPITVILALVYGYIPYMILPLYGQLDRINQSLLEAGRDLGASPARTFRRVTLPLSRQAILAGIVIVTLPMFGDYYTNNLLGSTEDVDVRQPDRQHRRSAGRVDAGRFLGPDPFGDRVDHPDDVLPARHASDRSRHERSPSTTARQARRAPTPKRFRNPWRKPHFLRGDHDAATSPGRSLPVMIAVIFSFNNGRSRSTWQGFSLRWWTAGLDRLAAPRRGDPRGHRADVQPLDLDHSDRGPARHAVRDRASTAGTDVPRGPRTSRCSCRSWSPRSSSASRSTSCSRACSATSFPWARRRSSSV